MEIKTVGFRLNAPAGPKGCEWGCAPPTLLAQIKRMSHRLQICNVGVIWVTARLIYNDD